MKFDSRGGPAVDFELQMNYYEGHYPYCNLYDAEGFSRYGTEATKGRRSFTCAIPFSELEATRHIRWRVVAVRGQQIVDRAPDRGWFQH
jgi:hypothetical protein